MTEGKSAFISFVYVACVVVTGPIFVLGKLLGLMSWSWVWILSPWWIPSATVAFSVFLWGIVSTMEAMFDRLSSDK